MDLHHAAWNGDLQLVKEFVERGVDVEKETGGLTPLMTASCHGHLEVLRYLLEQGANRDTSTEGETALHLAAEVGFCEIAKLLMVYGAELNVRNRFGELPIDVASTEEIKQAIRDEPRRRIDEAPGKRSTQQDQRPNAATTASTQQNENESEEKRDKQPAEGEAVEGEVADEDQDSEPSSDEDEQLMRDDLPGY